MIKAAYYNEIDLYAAQWLRNLIKAGHIAPGDVDERSILDVSPDDLRGYTQCHFFAGIGVWSLGLRRAGWPDDREVWTGSCPCQPFSMAGAGRGFNDERHVWPYFHHLISQRRPAVVFGEQVASKDAEPWLDLVQTDLEAVGYAFGAVAFPSAGVGAPHIRDRTYWVADAANIGRQRGRSSGESNGRHAARVESERLCDAVGMANADGIRQSGSGVVGRSGDPKAQENREINRAFNASGDLRLDNTKCIGRGTGRHNDAEHDGQQLDAAGDVDRTGPTNSLWRDADWLFCRDGKWRPVEPGTFPLAHGATSRVGRLRAYGNAVNAEAATVFIETYLDSI